jgi:hypothetical protein
MNTTTTFGYGDANAPSARVGAAWRQLGTHARAHHRAELAKEIAALRAPQVPDGERGPQWQWRWNPIRRQQLKLLAATY